jgi:shikimate kinase
VNAAGRGRGGAGRGRNLILIGYRGCGKSSVGRLVAERLGWPFTDTDERVEQLAGRCLRDIFQTEGETVFRRMESQVLAEILRGLDWPPSASRRTAGERRVVSVGGGAVLVAANRRRIRQAGLCVWLQAGVDELERRLAADPRTADRRPALTDLSWREEIGRLLALRAPLYADLADERVQTDGRSIAQVADELVAVLRSRGWLGREAE